MYQQVRAGWPDINCFPQLSTRTGIETDFQELVRRRRAAVVSRTSRSAAMSSSHGILTVLKAWNSLSAVEEVFSVGVLCSGKDAHLKFKVLDSFSPLTWDFFFWHLRRTR